MQTKYRGYTLICNNADRLWSVRRYPDCIVATVEGVDDAKDEVDRLILQAARVCPVFRFLTGAAA